MAVSGCHTREVEDTQTAIMRRGITRPIEPIRIAMGLRGLTVIATDILITAMAGMGGEVPTDTVVATDTAVMATARASI
jgi:hypothetical protein